MRVGEVMTPEVVAVPVDASWCYAGDVLTDAADILADNHVRRPIVVDNDNKLAGLLSLDDLAAKISSDRPVGDVLRHVSAA